MPTQPFKRRLKRGFVLTQLSAFLFTTFSPAYAATLSNSDPTAPAFPQNEATGNATNGATQSSSFTDLATQQASNAISGAASNWLNKFGTTQLDLDLDKHFKLRGGSLDMLVPLKDSKERLDYFQGGVRHLDDRTTLNLGLGQRHFFENWMLGYNGFFDTEPARGHMRLGMGVEAWRDYLKFAANGYLRLSDWKNSTLVNGYDERPANGYDLRLEGYAPFHPQLGAKLAYEQYFGDQVDLFSRDARGPNQSATTFGLNYTPVPMFTVSVDRRQGSGQADTRVGLQMTMQFDQSLSSQLDPSRMAERRSLAGSRYDLVSRNNRIVMEYREQKLLKLGLPGEVKGLGRQVLPLDVSIQSKYPVQKIVWQQDALTQAGGKIVDLGNNQYSVQLPPFNPTGTNSYVIHATAYDTASNRSEPATSRITVTGADIDVGNSSLAISPSVILANGSATSTLRVDLRDTANEPVSDMAAQLTATLTETPDAGYDASGQSAVLSGFTETTPGSYEATLTAATHPGLALLAPSAAGVALGETQVQMVLDTAGANIGSGDLTVNRSVIVANGSDAAIYTAIVKDAFGNVLPNITVNWTTDQGTLSAATSVTNAQGVAQIQLSSTTLGTAQVNAQVGTQAAVNAPTVQMVADEGSAQIGGGDLTVDKSTLTANGADTATYTAVVKDAEGHPVPNLTVTWATSLGQLGAPTSTTDANGVTRITLTGTIAGQAQVTAQVGTQAAVNAPVVTLEADAASAHIGSGDLTVDKTTLVANGTDTAVYTAIVKDANGNVLPNLTVTWASDNGNLSGSTSVTDADGVAHISLSGTKAGPAQATASVGTQGPVNAPLVVLQADASTARMSLSVDKTKITGTGAEDAMLTATLIDANNNPLINQTVTWTASTGTVDPTSVTDTTGATTVPFNAIDRTATNATATVSANFASASQSQNITVRAVENVAGRDYWTMLTDHGTSVEATAQGFCAAYGGGIVTTLTDLQNFTTGGGDFARMSVSGEFLNNWYNMAGTWGTTSGDFHSDGNPVGATNPGAGSGYVCVR
jgi:adhesin/invasin